MKGLPLGRGAAGGPTVSILVVVVVVTVALRRRRRWDVADERRLMRSTSLPTMMQVAA